jgi:hypothetical protein
MSSREELLKKAKRKMLIEKAKAKMASEKSPTPVSQEDMELDQTSMGFLGAEMPEPTEETMPLGESAKGVAEGMMNTLAGVGSGLPVVGPMVDEAAKTELISGRKGGMTDEQYSKLVEMGGGNREAGKAIGTMGGFMAAPGALLPQLGLSAADMASRKMIGGEDITAGDAALSGGLEVAANVMPKAMKYGMDKMSPSVLRKLAEINAVEALDPTSKQLGDMISTPAAGFENQRQELGRTMIDQQLLGGDKEAILKSLQRKRESLGNKLGDQVTDISSKASDVPTRKDISEVLKGKATDRRTDVLDDEIASHFDKASQTFKTPEMKEAERHIKKLDNLASTSPDPDVAAKAAADANELREMMPTGELDFENLVTIRKELDAKAFSAYKTDSPTGDKIKEVAKTIRDIEDDIAMGIDIDYKTTKGLYSSVKSLEKLAVGASGKAERDAIGGITKAINRTLPSIFGATTGFAVGGPVGGVIGTAVGNRAGRVWAKYGPQLKAAGFEKASKLPTKYLRELVEELNKSGPIAAGALHFKILQEDKQARKKHMKDKK